MIKALAASSHYNATFKLAKQLKERGHSVVYVGDDRFRESVLANDFDFYFGADNYIPYYLKSNAWSHSIFPRTNSNIVYRLRTFLYKFEQYFYILRRYGDDSFIYKSMINHERLISAVKPDLVILDIFYTYQIPLFYYTKTNLLIYQTKFPTNKDPGIPPLCSAYLPSDDLMAQFIISLLWKKYFLLKFLGDIKRRLKNLTNDKKYIFKKYAKSVGFPVRKYREKRAFHDGYSNIYELILSPEELNFKRKKRENQTYIGPVIDMDREETGYNYAYVLDREKLKILSKNKAVVYCSLGSLPKSARRTQALNFSIK
jgi:zeaxanthin glucosyltransferase